MRYSAAVLAGGSEIQRCPRTTTGCSRAGRLFERSEHLTPRLQGLLLCLRSGIEAERSRTRAEDRGHSFFRNILGVDLGPCRRLTGWMTHHGSAPWSTGASSTTTWGCLRHARPFLLVPAGSIRAGSGSTIRNPDGKGISGIGGIETMRLAFLRSAPTNGSARHAQSARPVTARRRPRTGGSAMEPLP